jgi:putative amino-acid transport system substrate-binding protein
MAGAPRIAFDRRNPPFSTTEAWETTGFSVALVRAAFAHAGIEIEVIAVDGPMAQTMWLAAGRVDAAADITVTERRRAWFAFSSYYHVEELMVFGREGGALWPGFRHFHGSIAVKSGSYVQEYLIRHFPTLRLIEVDSTDAELAAVLDGRADVLAATRETGMALIGTGEAPGLLAEGTPFGPAPLALATLRDEEQRVIEPFNTGLEALRQDGELDRLRTRWLGAYSHA